MKKARPTIKAEETDEFREFWSVWFPIKHHNDGRGSARDEFFRHVEIRGADPQDIVDGARWHVMSRKKDDFRPHAQTWLNRCDYEDGCELWRNMQAKAAASRASRSENVVQIASDRRSVLPANHFSRTWKGNA